MILSLKPCAWMLRNDGIAIPCVQHIYADIAELDETLYAAEWLYKNTLNDEAKTAALSLIKSYGVSLSPKNIIDAIKKDIAGKPYIFLTDKFIESVKEKIINSATGDIENLSISVQSLLNQEFTRTRYGGMYNTDPENRDLYFRISSSDFEWSDIILRFAKEFDAAIDTVTVVCDEESTGAVSTYYIAEDFTIADKMSFDDFIKTKVSTL